MLPKHLGIILDGCRRWATKNNLSISEGHRAGSHRAIRLVSDVARLGIEYCTMYCWSTENWSRPREELEELVKILREYTDELENHIMLNSVRVSIFGDYAKLAEFDYQLLLRLNKVVEASKGNTGLNLGMALNYGGRSEVVEAVKIIVRSGCTPESVSEELIESYLCTNNFPDVDFIIRTSGEQRLSNFLMWRSVYSELYFTDTYLPDFDTLALEEALAWYSLRQRRFGR